VASTPPKTYIRVRSDARAAKPGAVAPVGSGTKIVGWRALAVRGNTYLRGGLSHNLTEYVERMGRRWFERA
jgi:hypothetical protein